MKPLVTTICVALFLIAGAAMPGAQTTTAEAEKLLEGARHKEVMDGDLKAAIEQYRKIAVQFAKQPEIAARALFQLGQCQEKLGQAEARRSYERIVREYGGAQYASAARVRLAALGGDEAAGLQAMRAIWTGPKAEGYESSLSPDRRFISFPDWDTGNLGLHDLVTGADRLLTNSGTYKRGETAYAEASAISRDGRQVAYAWYDDKTLRYELRVLSLNGDPNPRRVFGNSSVDYLEPRDCSPDGKWIAANLWNNRSSKFGLIGTQDGSLRVLKSGSENTEFGRFSPDGRYLVYTRLTPGGNSRSYIISADGESEVPLVSGASSADSPVWTADGSRIIFVSDRSGSPGLWSVRVTDGKPMGEPELLKAGFGDGRPMGFARDGSLYYYLDLRPTDIYLAGLDPATGKLTSEPRRVNERTGSSWGRIAWLPDGKSLSFWNRSPIGALVEHTLATGEEREIWGGKSGRTSYRYAGWFPDGHTLMSWQQADGQVVFRRVDSKTGEAQRSWTVPALPSGSSDPVFSPDLMTMYFWQKDQTVPCEGVQCTYVMFARDLETGQDHEIFRINATYPWRGVSISHDGRYMAFIAGAERLMVAPTAGGAPRELYRVTDELTLTLRSTAWTRDGGQVLVLRDMPAGGEVWSFPTKGGPPEKTPLHMQPSEMPAVSPDGTQIAFVGGRNSSEIWVITGLSKDDKPEPKR